MLKRASFVEVNTHSLRHNFHAVKNIVPKDAHIMAVVKANAYGAGALKASEIFLQEGANYLGVATLDEALELRSHFSQTPILILGYSPNANASMLIDNDLSAMVFSLEQAEVFSQMALKSQKRLKIHLKIDTGMHRLGLEPTFKSIETIKKIRALKGLEVEGIFTHLSNADANIKTHAKNQMKAFNAFLEQLLNQKIEFKYRHAYNSAGILSLCNGNENRLLNLYRPGIMLYGFYPSNEMKESSQTILKNVISLKARIVQIKRVKKGEFIGYGEHFYTNEETLVGVLALGYADGLVRALGNRIQVAINNQLAPLIGKVCMDQCFVKLNGIEAKEGDEVILFGDKSAKANDASEIATLLNTIPYETISTLSKRLERVYV
ncbi:alanine racemase [Helicobacter pylori]|uniref:Alanine racemase n=1 Tax=Helicobacter pylori Hp H-24 TaxID=992039 RepID=J0KJL6_HELPX|nr:alanine racemase [Helicobacter pylori]EJB50862.1 alanine racemase [Helicobacter pylori Hp H-24]EJC16998.1 alanine racemase [Helicobacter pylori Hp H-24b]EJC19149.1 alanine racemase [Helicobacter pylori Hp H-24c]EJC38246.1 alanine racemase [Helicobacter pylori Hp M1]EJC41171.1 alanine racemase [Helicobacter pylori Hp M2]